MADLNIATDPTPRKSGGVFRSPTSPEWRRLCLAMKRAHARIAEAQAVAPPPAPHWWCPRRAA